MKMSVRLKVLSVCIIGCLAVPPSVAFAGPDEAARYYEQASEAYEQEEYARAADLLERAYAEDPNLIYQYNRILALQADGKFAEALEVLDIYGNPMKEDGRFDDIAEIRASLEQAKAKAEEKAKAQAEDEQTGDEAAQDDANDKTAGQETADKAQDKTQDQTSVEVPGGQIEPADDGPNILGWSLIGVGAASIGAGTLFGLKVFIPEVADRNQRLNDGDPRSEVYADFDDPSAQFQADQDAWNTNRTLNWTLMGVGAAALVGGGVVLLLGAQENAEADVPLSADNAELRLSPYVGADGAGGVLHISF